MNEPPRGPIKTFTLRGIKDSPPYLHDGRLLTLEDTVEFFNLVLRSEAHPARKGRPGSVYATALTNPKFGTIYVTACAFRICVW